MKKVLFLMFLLLLIGLGAVNVKAQVRIGGNTPPNPAAALDLNAAEGTTTGTKGLALPRVTLGSSIATLDGATANIYGMLIYNTGGTLSDGVYYWDGNSWVRLTNTTDGMGLPRPTSDYALLMSYLGSWITVTDSIRLAYHCTLCPTTLSTFPVLPGCLNQPRFEPKRNYVVGNNVCMTNYQNSNVAFYCENTGATDFWQICLMAR